MSGIGVEAQVNHALQRPAGRKRQRGELEISLAKTLPPNTGPHGHARQNDANRTESKQEEGLGVGGAPQFRQDRRSRL